MRKISVIIPCYNVENHIDRCIISIVAQTIGINNLEIIIVDDASTDNTWAQLQMWEQSYPDNVILIRQTVNGKQGTARNVGLQYASSEWIAFIDADDWLEPDYFEKLYEPSMQYECDVVCCGIERDFSDALTYYDEKDRENGEDLYIVPDTEAVKKEVIVTLFMGDGACGKMVRRSLLLNFQIFFPEGMAYEDMYWQSMIHIYVTGIYVVGKNLYHYFVNWNSTVLSKNEIYHIDWVTVWLMKWAEFEKRGLLKEYRNELEFDCIRDALGFLKLIVLRFDNPPFSLFQLAREILRERVPDYRINPYSVRFTGIYFTFLEKLYEESFDRTDFQALVDASLKYWRINGGY